MTRRTRLTLAQEIAGLAHASGMTNPMRRDDWRRPIRDRMLTDAREYLLRRAGAPEGVTLALMRQPLAQWPDKARAKVR